MRVGGVRGVGSFAYSNRYTYPSDGSGAGVRGANA